MRSATSAPSGNGRPAPQGRSWADFGKRGGRAARAGVSAMGGAGGGARVRGRLRREASALTPGREASPGAPAVLVRAALESGVVGGVGCGSGCCFRGVECV